MDDNWTVDSLISSTDAFIGNKPLADISKSIFEYTQFLLDDDENLTKTGNLNKPARDLLHKRTCELLDISDRSEDDDLEGDADDC